MQGRLLHLICRRLYSSTSQLSALRRFSSSSGEASTENLSISNREIPTQRIKQPQSYQQVPSENFTSAPNSESHPNPNPNLFPSSNINTSSDASLPEVQTCIWAVERLSRGKNYTGFERNQQRVPGYVCESDSPDVRHVLIAMDKFQLHSLWSLFGEEKFLRTIFTLEVFDGFGSDNILYRQRVLPRRINYNKSGNICNVGYVKAPPGMKLRLDVPIRICGQEDCTGLKKGGSLQVHLAYVSVFCLPEELPPYVQIYVNDMDIGDRICLGDLAIQELLHSKNQPSLPICEIV